MEKTYVYKWYTGQVFNGVLQNVLNPFELTQEINSAGSQIQIEIGLSFQDSGATTDIDLLVDQDGNYIVDQALDNIITRLDYEFPQMPSMNDRIEVWEFSADYPNGKRMFSGLVSDWEGGYKENTTVITVLGYGVQLDNYLVQILPESTLTQNPANNITTSQVLYSTWKDSLNRVIAVAQTFQLAGDSEVIKVRVTLGNVGTQDVPALLTIVSGTPTNPGSLIGSVVRQIPPQGNIPTEFIFSTALNLLGSTTYYFLIENAAFGISETNTLTVGVEGTGTYASGAMYTINDLSGTSAALTSDMSFEILSASGAIGNQFNSTDPSSMMRTLLDNFNGLGGLVSYTDDSIETSGTTVTYTFLFNTYLEAVRKVVELSPSNWYWYVDQAENKLYLQPRGTSPDHVMILGKHLEDMKIGYSLEGVKNKVYFSGGDTGGGENLLTFNSNEGSVTRYGNWLDLPSDNRVTLEDTANTLSQAILGEKGVPKFRGKITIPSSVYDVTLFRIGEIIGFANFNELINSLQLQIYSINYTPDAVTLTLTVLPPSTPKRVEDIRRNLRKQETVDNPNT